jgi:hypothetical protein
MPVERFAVRGMDLQDGAYACSGAVEIARVHLVARGVERFLGLAVGVVLARPRFVDELLGALRVGIDRKRARGGLDGLRIAPRAQRLARFLEQRRDARLGVTRRTRDPARRRGVPRKSEVLLVEAEVDRPRRRRRDGENGAEPAADPIRGARSREHLPSCGMSKSTSPSDGPCDSSISASSSEKLLCGLIVGTSSSGISKSERFPDSDGRGEARDRVLASWERRPGRSRRRPCPREGSRADAPGAGARAGTGLPSG